MVKAQTLFRQPVNTWRDDLVVPVTTKEIIGMLVRENK
jgi:hypothetical protein